MKLLITLTLIFTSIHSYGDTMSQAKRIKEVFNNLRADNLEILDQFYDTDVKFVDPLGTHNGLDSVKSYYGNLYKSVKTIEFIFTDEVSSGNTHAMMWTMKMTTKNLNDGKEMILKGNSHIVFNEQGLVTYHRDYFDMGEFIYEYIPVVGWIIKKIKAKLK